MLRVLKAPFAPHRQYVLFPDKPRLQALRWVQSAPQDASRAAPAVDPATLYHLVTYRTTAEPRPSSFTDMSDGICVAPFPHTQAFRLRVRMRVEAIGIDEVLQRIQGEFVEMPGLRLTAAQAQRLWGLDREFCNKLLSSLVDAKFLEQTRDGAFVRLEGARPTRLAASGALARSAVA